MERNQQLQCHNPNGTEFLIAKPGYMLITSANTNTGR